jgi:SAM-dependent methyltransferase
VGTDFSKQAVSLSKARLAGRANVLQADVTDLPFPNMHFSHVLLFGIIEHIRDEAKALAEIRRVSRPGARIYFTTSNYFSALQGVNFIRRNTYGYPYGYQKNWETKVLEARLGAFLTVRRVEYVHADWDMPLVRTFDKAAAWVFPKWARYIHVSCELDT